MPTTRVRRTETSITRHPLRYACSQAHHAGYARVETQWADGEGGFYRAYRCSNCEATWVDQHINAEQPHIEHCGCRPRPRPNTQPEVRSRPDAATAGIGPSKASTVAGQKMAGSSTRLFT